MKPNCGIVFHVEPTAHTVRRGTFRLVGEAAPEILGVDVIGASEVFDVVRHSRNRGFRIVGGELKPRAAMQIWIRLKGELKHDAAIVGKFMRD